MTANRQELLDLLRESLTVEVERSEVYTGGLDGSGSLYKKQFSIKLKLDGETFSEADLSCFDN